jgi:hypothetical protein
MNNKVECPIDFIIVNENHVRLVAAQVFITSVLLAFTVYWPIVLLLIADFVLRATYNKRYSPLAFIAYGLVKLFSIKEKPTDYAPKRFAAWIGFTLSVVILLLLFWDLQVAAITLAAVLAIFSFLESAFGFCAGCYIYSAGKKLLPVRK